MTKDLAAKLSLLAEVTPGQFAKLLNEVQRAHIPRPASEWHEDHGAVLWWRFPLSEPPWVGSQLDDDWTDDYYTHWTPIPVVVDPSEEVTL